MTLYSDSSIVFILHSDCLVSLTWYSHWSVLSTLHSNWSVLSTLYSYWSVLSTLCSYWSVFSILCSYWSVLSTRVLIGQFYPPCILIGRLGWAMVVSKTHIFTIENFIKWHLTFDPDTNTHTNYFFSYDPPYSRGNIQFFFGIPTFGPPCKSIKTEFFHTVLSSIKKKDAISSTPIFCIVHLQ